jgi:ABC-2 type transport system permease protein
MVSQSPLIRRSAAGWRMGFANMLDKENRAWWNVRTLLIQIILWSVLVNGILSIVAIIPSQPQFQSPATQTAAVTDPTSHAAMFPILMGLFAAIGVVVMIQDALVSEKQSGTAAWVLTKPISRAAFVLAKLVAHGSAVGVVIIGAQGALAYLIAPLSGEHFGLLSWIAGLGALYIYFLFYITLTLMLGTFFNGRGAVIGVPLLLIFSGQMLQSIAPGLANFGPWLLILPDSSGASRITQIIQGNAGVNLLPVLATVIWSIVFSAVAIWRFRREEF